MALEVRLSRTAERDLKRLGAFLLEKNPRAAMAAVSGLSNAIRTLDTLAERGRIAPGRPDHREIVVPFGRDGYVIRYRIGAEHVVIARIKHQREAK